MTIELKLEKNGCNEKGSFVLNKFSDIILNQVVINHESELVVTELDAERRKLANMLEINIPTGQLSRTLCRYTSKCFHPIRNQHIAKK